ncbi:hypothetical protein ELE36_17230 [Pseudolysobacter antarcticus]|uniref:Exo-alpha-sialidase n=1 Tax=Pseudolysobacter antarcticus TaxID=2511995 RepID=A0A411HNB4_9GAMM|nr:hypothetical protein [Pseudolysobacter antarcticus]QBB71964.1 hypothetical protein ELE36_17230 [Pseudolysobacter antarcticus]
MYKLRASYWIALCCVALAITGAAIAGPADWSGQGPFGGSVYALRADPLLGSRIYAYTSNGFFRSDDGGTSWQLEETGLAESHPATGVFVADVNTSGGVWLFDDYGRLYHSTDAGSNWSPTGFTAPAVPNFATNGFAQGTGAVLWYSAGSNGLLKSTDGGATFAAVGGVFAGQAAQFVVTNPTNPLQVVVGLSSVATCSTGNCAIYYSSNGGSSWFASTFDGVTLPSVLSPGVQMQRSLKAVSFGPSGSHRIYALYSDLVNYYQAYLIRSDNDGAAWKGYDQSTPGASLPQTGVTLPGVALAASPSAVDTVYLDSAISTNGGTSFTPLSSSGRTTNGTILPSISAIALHAGYPSRVLAGTSFAGIYLSNNSGSSWSGSNDGLAATNIRALLIHPQDHTRLFAGYGDALSDPSPAFYRSTTAGTWNISNSGLNAYQLRTLAFDQTTTGVIGSTVIFAVGNGFDGAASPVNRNTGIYKSADGGLTWSTIGNGLPKSTTTSTGHYAGALRTIITDPRSCAAPPPSGPCVSGPLLTLYATGGGTTRNPDGTFGSVHQWRVMKSIDGGVNWVTSETGLPADQVNGDGSGSEVDGVTPIVIDPTNSQILYIGTFASGYDALFNSASPTVPTGVFKSIDGGGHWTQASNGLPTYPGAASIHSVYNTLSLIIDPAHPQTLWVSTINANFNLPGEIYKTTDGAANWTVSNAGVSGPDVRALLVDPTDSTVLYAASGGLGPANPGGVYKSIDSGTTWSSISLGLPAQSALSLALDPVDPTVLYAGTSGGVYSITQLPDADADGVPDLIENAGPNGGDGNGDNTPDALQPTVSTTAPGLLGTFGWQAGVEGIADGSRAQQLSQKLQQLQHGQSIDANGTQGGYFTVQIISGDCTHAVDVSAVLAGPLGVDSDAHHGTYSYTRGLLRFELPLCTNAVVDITFNGATFGPGWSWRYYGPSTPGDNSTLGWHNATSLVQSQTGNKWRVNLVAGQFGSYRPAGANSILFEGGPAFNEEIFKDGFQ